MDQAPPCTDLTSRLRERGQRVTPQRLVLHDVVRRLGRHVTADEVQHAAVDRLPGVSLPTVYATLELFEELGIVRRVPAGAGAVLYDPRTDPHHHLVCGRCGRVEDLDVDVDATAALDAARARGAQPERAEVVVGGLCAACARDAG